MTNLYGRVPGQYEAIMALIKGPLSFNFWVFDVMLMMVLPFIILMSKNGFQPQKVFLAGILTIIGNLFARIDLVFAGQIVPQEYLPGSVESGTYYHAFVSWSEWGVLLGAAGGAILLYLLGEKFFKLDMDEHHENGYQDVKSGSAVKA